MNFPRESKVYTLMEDHWTRIHGGAMIAVAVRTSTCECDILVRRTLKAFSRGILKSENQLQRELHTLTDLIAVNLFEF